MRPLGTDVTYFRAQGLTNAFANPAEFAEQLKAATDLFGAVDINLGFEDGGMVSGDPWGNPSWIKSQVSFARPQTADSRRRVVLLLSQTHIDSENINGMLAHPNSRSVVVLFTDSSGFVHGTPEQHFQILVHELGHAFNLVHTDAVIGPAASVMNQDSARPNSRSEMDASWRLTLGHLDERDRPAMEEFFQGGRRNLIGLPFSPGSVAFLKRSEPENRVLPWGEKFRDIGDNGWHDHADPELVCELVPEREDWCVGEPFDFQLRIRNTSRLRQHSVPLHLGMKFGNVCLHVRRPDGHVYEHKSRSQVCGVGRRILKPNEQIVRSFSVLHGPGGVVFPFPGQYVIELTLPNIPLYADPLVIDVGNPRLLALSDRYFQRFIGDGLPVGSKRNWNILDTILDAPGGLPPAVINHLAYLHATTKPRTSRARELFRRALDSQQGHRIREKALLRALRPDTLEPRWRTYESEQMRELAHVLFSRQDVKHPSLIRLGNDMNKEEPR